MNDKHEWNEEKLPKLQNQHSNKVGKKALKARLILNYITLVMGICWHYWLPVLLTVQFCFTTNRPDSIKSTEIFFILFYFLQMQGHSLAQFMWNINVETPPSPISLPSGYDVKSLFYNWVVNGRALECMRWSSEVITVVTIFYRFNGVRCFCGVLYSCRWHQFQLYL